jgi:DNA invertase Pin-like site-specific DNA recombinase
LLALIADLDARGIELVILSLAGERFNTRLADSRLTLRILAGVAEWERAIMFERQRGGITKARAEGRYKGRPRRINPDDVTALAGTMSVLAIAHKLNISRSSTYRMLQQTPRKP